MPNTLKSKTFRMALIGCGAIAELFYLPALKKIPEINGKLILVDVDEKRVKAMSQKFSIRQYALDYKKIIKDVDGAIIALPHHLHYQITMEFLKNGVHILCEKPLAEMGEEAKQMVEEAKKQNVLLCVNNTRRLYPSFQKTKEFIDKGTIGEIISLQLEEGATYNWPTISGFYFNAKSGGGVLMDTGSHVLDLVCWWFDSKPRIISCFDDSFGGCEATALINFYIKDSVDGYIKLSRLSKLKNQYIIKGKKGAILLEPWDWRTLRLLQKNKIKTMRLPSSFSSFSDFGFKITSNFVNSIKGKEKPLIPGEDVINSISALEECYRNRQNFFMPWVNPSIG